RETNSAGTEQTLENYHIEWREIPEQRFREVAAEKGYAFQSEEVKPAANTPPIRPADSPGASPETSISGPSPCPDGWIKVEWKADCTDTLRKAAYQPKRVGDSFDRTDI